MGTLPGRPVMANRHIQWHTVAMAIGQSHWPAFVVCHQLGASRRANGDSSGSASCQCHGRGQWAPERGQCHCQCHCQCHWHHRHCHCNHCQAMLTCHSYVHHCQCQCDCPKCLSNNNGANRKPLIMQLGSKSQCFGCRRACQWTKHPAQCQQGQCQWKAVCQSHCPMQRNWAVALPACQWKAVEQEVPEITLGKAMCSSIVH